MYRIDMRNFQRRTYVTGFTLIELMITVVVVAILASIAVPSYRQYVIRGNRNAAQSVMMDLANREQQFLMANRRYADHGTLIANGYTLPPEVGDHYDWKIDIGPAPGTNGPPTYLITFMPKGGQASDLDISLDSAGKKMPEDKWKR